MKNKIILLFTIFILTASCKTGVEITFTNESKEDFKTLDVGVGKKSIVFRNIESGESTIPLKVDGSYPYCYAKVTTQKDTITFRPIDFMGERFYKSGKLKMKLTIYTDKNGKRHLNFVN